MVFVAVTVLYIVLTKLLVLVAAVQEYASVAPEKPAGTETFFKG